MYSVFICTVCRFLHCINFLCYFFHILLACDRYMLVIVDVALAVLVTVTSTPITVCLIVTFLHNLLFTM